MSARSPKEVQMALDIAKLLDRLVEEYGDDALAATSIPDIADWIADGLTHPVRALTTWELEALRAAIHEDAGPCISGRFDACFDLFHQPPIDLEEWWPPLDPRGLS